MRWAPIVVVSLVLLALPGAATGVSARTCVESGTTVDANSVARLFYVGAAGTHTLYVCWLDTRRITELGTLDLRETGPDVPVLAGRYVAYDRLLCSEPEDCVARVVVRDAKTGRQVARAPAQPGRTARIVLTTRGTAVWIRDRVYRLDARSLTVLDEGGPPAVDYFSLGLGGSHVYWLHDGEARSAVVD